MTSGMAVNELLLKSLQTIQLVFANRRNHWDTMSSTYRVCMLGNELLNDVRLFKYKYLQVQHLISHRTTKQTVI